jgi:transcriptional regulator with XRE-family HTH domain
MNDIYKKLGKNIKEIREEKNMTQGDIHRASGLDRAYISRIESGLINPTVSNLEKIANALNISPDKLLK